MKAIPAAAIWLDAVLLCEESASFIIWFSDISIQTRWSM
tara:strand:- start:334 stop:450 length:117 start_codon:yes stop_codon:yes gene_type:complete